MAKTLDFTKVKKNYLPVIFDDETKTTIFVGTPTKALLDELLVMQSSFDELSEDGADETNAEDLYIACSKVMSRNKTGAKITKEYLESVFDFEDIIIFFHSYMDFISEVVGRKN